jgi:hypothetical protein
MIGPSTLAGRFIPTVRDDRTATELREESQRPKFMDVLAFSQLFLLRQDPGKLMSGIKLNPDNIKCT